VTKFQLFCATKTFLISRLYKALRDFSELFDEADELTTEAAITLTFYFTLIHNYTSDNMLRTVFMPQCSAVDLVYHLFDVYVG